MRSRVAVLAFCWMLTQASLLRSELLTYDNKVSFLRHTLAEETVPLPTTNGLSVSELLVGELAFTTPSQGGLASDEYSVRLPGNVISVNAYEHLDIAFASEVYSYGFDFHEPEFDPNRFGTFVDSTFTVELFYEVSSVGTFSFDAPQDIAAFVGVWSNTPFNRIEIREIVGGWENEFYGQPYIGLTPLKTCDFDHDTFCDVHDLDMMHSIGPIASGVPVTDNFQFDLDGDGTIDLADRDQWLADAATENGLGSPYKPGDANLDGTVDGVDFLAWNDAKFSSSLLWSDANFNGDVVVGGSDFLAWNHNKFTSSDGVNPVPEPAARLLLLLCLSILGLVRKQDFIGQVQ